MEKTRQKKENQQWSLFGDIDLLTLEEIMFDKISKEKTKNWIKYIYNLDTSYYAKGCFLNYVYQNKKSYFLMSQNILNKMIEEDPNIKNKRYLSKTEYFRLVKRMVDEGVIGFIYKVGGSYPSVFFIEDEEILKDIWGDLDEEDLLRKKENIEKIVVRSYGTMIKGNWVKQLEIRRQYKPKTSDITVLQKIKGRSYEQSKTGNGRLIGRFLQSRQDKV